MEQELKEIKESLKHGDQRKIAIRMGEHPARVSDAFSGLVKSKGFLVRLQAEAKALIAERTGIPA